MLNILVCVKQVPDINLVKMDPVTGSLIRAGVPAILNPLDANALEAAVRVKEAHGGTVTVITMGPDMAKEALRECLAPPDGERREHEIVPEHLCHGDGDVVRTAERVLPVCRKVKNHRERQCHEV